MSLVKFEMNKIDAMDLLKTMEDYRKHLSLITATPGDDNIQILDTNIDKIKSAMKESFK